MRKLIERPTMPLVFLAAISTALIISGAATVLAQPPGEEISSISFEVIPSGTNLQSLDGISLVGDVDVVGDLEAVGKLREACAAGDVNLRWIPGNQHCYMWFDTAATYVSARRICEDLGGYLVTLTDPDEETFLVENLQPLNDFYIGYTDARSEGSWEWITGEVAVMGQDSIYENWGEGEPNDVGGEDCAVLETPIANGWNDAACDIPRDFVCEKDL